MDNMTALVSAFARAYHYRNNDTWVFADELAQKLLTEEEYASVSGSMADGIAFFAPGFSGTREEALRYVVDRQLAPPVLARSAFCERAIRDAIRVGCAQIMLFAAGYDTFSLRAEDERLDVFELDRPEMIRDKEARVRRSGLTAACRCRRVGCDLSLDSWREPLIRAGFDPLKRSFGSLLGISDYLTKAAFGSLLRGISALWSAGSSVCFDYPLSEEGSESRINRELAAAAGERMKARYTQGELERALADAGFLIYEHLDAGAATEQFFKACNEASPKHPMAAPRGVGYCLAVKRG